MAKPALDLSTLTPDEKADLIDDLWSSLRSDELMLTPDQKAELDRRLERLDRDGPVGTPWETVRGQMSRRES
jgi:putative addiction module component (TIGR02574 family)